MPIPAGRGKKAATCEQCGENFLTNSGNTVCYPCRKWKEGTGKDWGGR